MEDLLALHALAAVQERGDQVGRRDKRYLVLSAEQAGCLGQDLALDPHGLGVLALPIE